VFSIWGKILKPVFRGAEKRNIFFSDFKWMQFCPIKLNIIVKLPLLVPSQFISKFLIKFTTVFQWYSQYRCMKIKAHFHHSIYFWVLWQIVPWQKKPSLVPLIWAWLYLKGMKQFFKVILPLLCSLKKIHFLFHNLWSDLFLCWNSSVGFTLKDYMDSVLWFQMVD